MLPPSPSCIIPALKDAFPHTIPIMLGYVFMGAVFGILLQKSGFNALWESFLLVSMINARQIFYSISMLERFKQMGKKSYYMIYSLTDETLALLNLKTPKVGCG